MKNFLRENINIIGNGRYIMGYVQFLAWLTARGLRVAQPLARRAFNAWVKYNKKLPAEKNFNQIANSAKNMAAEKSTQVIPPSFNKFVPKIVKNKWTDRHGKTWMRDEKGRPIQITEGLGKYKLWKAAADVKRSKLPEPPKTVTDKLGKVFEEKVVESAKILPFKRPPGKFKGGIIDKALPGRSRDI
jgi:hypothetical protein